MFFSRAPAGGQSLPIPSIEHRRSAHAKLALRVRAGALRPRPSAHPWCAPWLVLFFVRVTSIEHRQTAPRPFGERSGQHLPSGSRFFWSRHLNRTSPKRSRALSGAFWPLPTLVFVLAFASTPSIEHRQSAPRLFGERFGIASHVQVMAFAVAVALGGLEGSLRRLFAEDRSGAEPKDNRRRKPERPKS